MSFRERIGLFLLKKRISKIPRHVEFNNFETADSIGIIFDASERNIIETVKTFINEIRGVNKRIKGLAFIPNPELILELPQINNITYFSKKDLNWYFAPSNKSLIDFCHQPFDLLIDLSCSDLLAFKFLVALSKAKCKIGKGSLQSEFYDFMINVPENKPLIFFISQLKHYLSVIKPVKA